MNTVAKIQLMIALQSKLMSRDEALFFMSLVNSRSSIDSALDAVLTFAQKRDMDKIVIPEEYDIHECIIYSNAITQKLSSVDITSEDIKRELGEIE